MTRINQIVSFCFVTLALLSLSILSYFDPTIPIDNIGNIIFLVFICVYVSCSFKLTFSNFAVSIWLLLRYLGDFYNTGSGGHFTINSSGLAIYIVIAVAISALLSLLYILFLYPDGKAKLKSLMFIVFVIIGFSLCFISLPMFTSTFGFLSYIFNIGATILFIISTYFASKFYIIDILDL